MSSFKFSGHINCYRFFDIGGEVNLQKADAILSNLKSEDKFNLGKISRSLVIEEDPLVLFLGKEKLEILGDEYSISITGKLWNFGVLSISIKVNIYEELAHSKLKELAIFLENDDSIHKLAVSRMEEVFEKLSFAIKEKKVWRDFEDYIIFCQDPEKCSANNASELISDDALYELVLLEPGSGLSEQMLKPLRDNTFQYTTKDLVILDWNSSFVMSKGDHKDICDVVEFALCQLLQLRYFDDLLDKELAALYKSIQGTKKSIWKGKYAGLFKKASKVYIELSEIIEKVENSLKVTGDVFYAKLYRAGIERFRIKDWQSSVDQKLKNLLDVSTLFQSEFNSRKDHLLEIVIIVLIAIEVIPFIWGLFK